MAVLYNFLLEFYNVLLPCVGGIAEMAGLGEHIRHKTDALDAAGNTTAAVGKVNISHFNYYCRSHLF